MESDANADYCAAAVRQGDHDRYLATVFAPDAARAHLLALYAFNLELARVRDSVSEPILGQMRLQWWREAVAAIDEGREPPHHAVVRALADAIRGHGLPRAALEALIDARERDLDDDPPRDLAALEAYAEATAGTLAVLALRVLGATDAAAMAAGRDAGAGWALTGLLRAVPHHARGRRLYLPAEVLAAAGADAEAVFAGRATDGVRAAVAAVAAARAPPPRRRPGAGRGDPADRPRRGADRHLGRPLPRPPRPRRPRSVRRARGDEPARPPGRADLGRAAWTVLNAHQ